MKNKKTIPLLSSTAAALASLMMAAGAHAADLPYLVIDNGDTYTPSVEHDPDGDRPERHGNVDLIDGRIVAGTGPFSDAMEVTDFFTAMKGEIGVRLFGEAYFDKMGSDLVSISVQSDLTSLVYVSEGTLRTDVADAFAQIGGIAVGSGAVFDLNGYDQSIAGMFFVEGNGRVIDSSGSGHPDGGAVVTADEGYLLYGGEIDVVLGGAGDLSKYDGFAASLNRRNTFTGDVYVFEGTLRTTVDSAIAEANHLFVADGIFDVAGTAQSVAGEVVLINGAFDDSSAAGTGTLSSRSGAITLQDGDVNVALVDDPSGVQVNVYQVGWDEYGDVTRLNVATRHTGETAVISGRLQTTVDDAVASSSRLEVTETGSFDVFGTTQNVKTLSLYSGSLDDTLGNGVILTDGRFDLHEGAVNVTLGGGGGLSKSGSGTVELNRTSHYTGGTHVTGGRLEINAVDAIPFGSDLHVTGEAAAVFLNDHAQTLAGLVIAEGGQVDLGKGGANDLAIGLADAASAISGRLTGTGSLRKRGEGELLVDGQVMISGALDLQGGMLTLVENDSFNVGFGGVNVHAGAFMQGAGNILGGVRNHGTVISAGGVLDVAGYVQGADGTFVVAFNERGETGKLVSFEAVELAGTLQVFSGGHDFKGNESFEIIRSEEGVVSRFDEVADDFGSSRLTLSVDYRPDSVWLEFLNHSFASLAETPNQRAVARALDRAEEKGRLGELIARLNQGDLSEIPGLLSLLSPESLSAIFHAGFASAQVQQTHIERRLDAVRAGSRGFSAGGLSLQDSRGTLHLDGAPLANDRDGLTLAGWDGRSVVGRESVAPVVTPGRWGFFITGSGEWADVETTSQAKGSQLTSGGVTVGADYRVSEAFVLGLSAGYVHTGVDLAFGGKMEANGGRGNLYGIFFHGGAYLNAAVGGGYNAYRIKRATLGGTARGDTDGGEFDALLGGGYDYEVCPGFTVGPVASAAYTYLGVDGYRESGSAAPQDLADNSAESLRSALGVKLAGVWNVGGLRVSPEVRAQWKHEFLDAKAVVGSSFVGGGGTFAVEGPKLGRDSLVIDAGASIEIHPGASVFAYYLGEIGRTHYESHSVNGGIRINF
ncbi:MAG TPA: autotransporter domain-containing protein [Chthoniobacteraceae bacterium]|nr:autotransporter domain-containing protein [Chthoniobacteraceae bacterium]